MGSLVCAVDLPPQSHDIAMETGEANELLRPHSGSRVSKIVCLRRKKAVLN